ncbi:MAG: beta-N-acetylglucosaminidase domain-containing protein [Actinomyces sp.]|uniref:beta-N-acetylhexosaminidase family protein n=1 Tax=Actinomyces sp. TaxID=29317 RepID=UPI0026DC8AC6|nr:beta-N-acetylglucosaminidase domain-containing protein [Actinomyces sp.]MDO4242345.1 beta-N-acetylglucosaminidase domain-containing protein [Actinomyces sp.]
MPTPRTTTGRTPRARRALACLLGIVLAGQLAACLPQEPDPSAAQHATASSATSSGTAAAPGSTAPTAAASAPASPTTSTPGAPSGEDGQDTEPVLPRTPQSIEWNGADLDLSGAVSIVNLGGQDTAEQDAALTAVLDGLVTSAGGTVVEDSAGAPTARIVIGTGTQSAAAAGHLPEGMAVPEQAEGYATSTTATDIPTVVVLGADADGAFYGAMTLGHLVVDGTLHGASITDWPLMSVRGVVEGFYGTPWSHEARTDMLAFMGEHALNTYIYAPKDDPYLRAQWRDPYPAAELAELSLLASTARAHHVDLVVALSPGTDICYTSQADFDATVAVLDQLRSAGVTRMSIALDDISPTLSCESDIAAYGETPTDLVAAQSAYLNRVQEEYLRHHGLPDLIMVPTEYTGVGTSPAKSAQAQMLDPAVQVQWTGDGIVTESITSEQAASTASAYGTDGLIIWDNYPVNDGDNAARIFLGAVEGRDPDLHEEVVGITSNPMLQAYASMPVLASYGSYTWNGPGYDPDLAHDEALAEIAGSRSGQVWDTLEAFADLSLSWPFSEDMARSPALSADVAAFEAALAGDDEQAVDSAAQTLQDRLALLAQAPDTLTDVEVAGFYEDCEPWILAAADWARAASAAVDLRLALRAGDEDAAAEAGPRMEQTAQEAAAERIVSVSSEDSADGSPVEKRLVPEIGDGLLSGLVEAARAEQEG